MKTFTQIQKEKRNGDYKIIAKAIGQSALTIRSKVQGKRGDLKKIVQKAFTILLVSREENERLIMRKIKREIKKIRTR
jgi:hypothetical protein